MQGGQTILAVISGPDYLSKSDPEDAASKPAEAQIAWIFTDFKAMKVCKGRKNCSRLKRAVTCALH